MYFRDEHSTVFAAVGGARTYRHRAGDTEAVVVRTGVAVRQSLGGASDRFPASG